MNLVIDGRKPASLFRFFEEISAIPRPSYHEEKIADYLVAFAKERGLECYRDASHNVLIKMHATKGKEGVPPILFQGHTDMVCEKNADVEHDFLKDPIKLVVDGKMLRAKGTTLGADNGVAVATMLAILDGEIDVHPAVECLFTTAEEVGLDGANSFDYNRISARRLVNLDSEELNLVTAGCAGGVRSDIVVPCKIKPLSGSSIRVSVSGLMGGHSGANINSGRANANKLMGRLLSALYQTQQIALISLAGGSKDNAIPRECEAILAVSDLDAAIDLIADTAAEIANELSQDDKGFCVVCEETEAGEVMMDAASTLRILSFLSGVQSGVITMSPYVKGLVEFSRNLSVIKTEGETVSFVLSTRSSMESQLEASINELTLLAKLLGASIHHHGRYPGWSYAKESAIRDAYLAAHRAVTGRDAEVNAIHAGLECGIISSKLPGMDMISVGPDMFDIHSPDEALDLESVEKFWQIIETLVKNL